MKIYIVLCCISILLTNAQENPEIEEGITEICGNGTDDSCEAFNTTELVTVSTTPEVLSTTVPSKKQKTTTAKSVTKKPAANAPNATVPLERNPDCTCDDSRGECEMNCCCDVDCSPEHRAVFTHCVSGMQTEDTDQCYQPQDSSVVGVMCIVRQNTVQSTDHTDVPVLRTVSSFEKKLGKKIYYAWPNPLTSFPTFDVDISYGMGSPVWITDNSSIFHLEFPASIGHSSLCHSTLVPKYLEEMSTSCTNPLESKFDCLGSKEVHFNVISSPRNFNFTQIQECTEDVCLPIHQNICINTSCTEAAIPDISFNESNSVCQNVVVSTEYKIYHNGTQGIIDAKVYYTLKNMSIRSGKLFRKKYSVTFLWATGNDQPVLKRSGKPGYEVGKPLITGKRTVKSVAFNFSSTDWINVGTAESTGKCLSRQNVLFGENLKTWCLLDVNGTCSQIQQQIWNQLLGPVANLSETVVSSYGDPYTKGQSWVPLLSTSLPPLPALVTAVDINVVHSLVGSVASPQAKIIGVYVNYLPTTAVCDSNHTTVAVETSVRFIDKTRPAVTKFAQPPVYEIKLPQDFFYPFFSGSGRCNFTKKSILFMIFLLFI